MNVLAILLLFVPAAIAAEFLHAGPVIIFALSALAIVPLSGYLGRATEEIAAYTGPTLGGLLNATLGNLAELIIAILALAPASSIWSRRRSLDRFSEISCSCSEPRSSPAGFDTRRSASASRWRDYVSSCS